MLVKKQTFQLNNILCRRHSLCRLFREAVVQEVKLEFPLQQSCYTMMRTMQAFSPPDIDIQISLDPQHHRVRIEKIPALTLPPDVKPRTCASILVDVTLFYHVQINENM
jgi:hypothetical protein